MGKCKEGRDKRREKALTWCVKLLRMVEIWVPEKASVVQVKQKDLTNNLFLYICV